MRRSALSVPIALLLAAAAPVWPQSIVTEGSIATDAQLVSNVVTGTAPLAVSSTTMVPNFNADRVDGIEGTALALDADLQTAEAMLVALQAQVDALGLALVPRTGQTTCFDATGAVIDCAAGIGPGQDGALVMGVQWPNPRFTKNGNGTVTDNLTGLIWLEDANCAGTTMQWGPALAFANTLFDGSAAHNGGDCGLSDLSGVGAWRLPNLRELQSLVHYGVSSPAVPNTVGTGKWVPGAPFFSVQSAAYWSSTSYAVDQSNAWDVHGGQGQVSVGHKTFQRHVWPVRGGQ